MGGVLDWARIILKHKIIFKCFVVILFTDGNWGDWSLFSSCSVTCNEGIKTRTRSCNHQSTDPLGKGCFGENTEVRACNDSPCPIGKQNFLSAFLNVCFGEYKEIIACSQLSFTVDKHYKLDF